MSVVEIPQLACTLGLLGAFINIQILNPPPPVFVTLVDLGGV